MVHVSTRFAERQIGCSRSKLYKLIEENRLQVMNTSTGKRPSYRVIKSSLDEFLRRSVVTPGGVSGPSVAIQ